MAAQHDSADKPWAGPADLPDAAGLDRADAELGALAAVSGEQQTVDGVLCTVLGPPYPWAVSARPLEPPTPAAMARIADWLGRRAPQWTIRTHSRHLGAPAFAGLEHWNTLPAYVLADPGAARGAAPSVPGLHIEEVSAADGPAGFLSVYGAELAPLVTDAHLADPRQRFLLGRVDGEPVACAQLRFTPGPAYLSAVTVRPEFRKRGYGTAISAAATRRGLAGADRVWLHAASGAERIYRRLGFRHVGDHVQLLGPAR